MYGKKNWVFCDGDLPPRGNNPDFPGHEALMITNVSTKDASIRIKILFEDKDIIVCIKPCGVLSQSDDAGRENMISILQEHVTSHWGCSLTQRNNQTL